MMGDVGTVLGVRLLQVGLVPRGELGLARGTALRQPAADIEVAHAEISGGQQQDDGQHAAEKAREREPPAAGRLGRLRSGIRVGAQGRLTCTRWPAGRQRAG
jgi:hypothetical protein